MSAPSYANDLRTLRVALDIDLRHAAQLCRMSVVVYGAVERGDDPLTAETFASLVHALLRPTREEHRANVRRLRATLADALNAGSRK